MKVTIIGAGYVGLTTGVCISSLGYDVTCLDKDIQKVKTLSSGHLPFYEPNLSGLLQSGITNKKISFTTQLEDCIPSSDIIFVAVGTPPSLDGSADLSMLFGAITEIAEYLTDNTVIVIKSTVPVGTNEKVKKMLCSLNVGVVSNPEFLRQGSAVDDFMKPDRVVIGSDDDWASQIIKKLYQPISRDCPVIITDPASAELIKYTANSMLATRLSVMNEVAMLCERVGADIDVVSNGVGLDSRIGSQFLKSGAGYGGSCLPKDVQQLMVSGQEYDVPQTVVGAAHSANKKAIQHAYKKILESCDGNVKNKTIAFFGVTFKPNTDDMREAPSAVIIPQLIESGANVRAVDPTWRMQAKRCLPDEVKWHDDIYVCSYDADVIVLMTEWNCFLSADLYEISSRMSTPRMVDLRNLYDSDYVISCGFDMYISIGKPTVAL